MSDMTRFEWEAQAYSQPFNGEALRVLWCYANHADANTLLTFPKIRDVAEETRISVEKVGKYRKALLATGWLVESDEKTARGNAKLMLAVGGDIETYSYLGEKKAMNPKSMGNLVPGAKQKKAAGSLDTPDESQATDSTQPLDTPDEAGLEHREGAGLEHREIEGLDTPDVTTSELNNHSLSTNNNHASADANAVTIGKEEGMYEYLGSLNVEDFEDLSLTHEGLSYDYLANSEGVTKVANSSGSVSVELLLSDEAPAPSKTNGKKAPKVKVVGWSPDMTFFNKMVMKKKDPAKVAAARAIYEDPAFMPGKQPIERYAALGGEVARRASQGA